MGYKSETQNKNIAWFLPRPHPSQYRGGMPLHCEKWLFELAADILNRDFDKLHILSLFSGMCEYGIRVDLNPEVKPDILADAHKFVSCLPDKTQSFDVVLADPPYSDEEANELYSEVELPPLKYRQWTREADEVLRIGGLLIVYHKYVMPNPNPKTYEVAKRVFIGNRTYHVPRVATYFRKHGIRLLE